jgi:PAS domain S-box-containing protein
MLWKYLLTPNLWLSLFTLAILIALSLHGWYRRGMPGALLLAAGSLLSAVWILGTFLESISPTAAEQIFWFKFQAFLKLPATTAVTCFALEYTRPGRWLTRRNLVLLSVVPVLATGLMLTNDWHHLVWLDFNVNGDSVVARYGWTSSLMYLYSYGLALLNVIVFGWLFLRSPQHRWPVAIMVNGMIVARSLYLLEILQVIATPIPVDVLSMGYVYLMFGIALFGFRFFNPIELARRSAIAQMREGMLVLDLTGRVVSLNPAGQAILGVSEKQAAHRPVQELLPLPQELLPLPDGDRQVEINLGQESAARSYQLTLSALQDWRGLPVGRLLLLHDITEQKRAQAELIEQQHTRATLQERERLARELHDTLVQSTASVRMQAETATLLLQNGQPAPVEETLMRIADTAQQMHLDLRQYIFKIRAGLAAEQPFFEVLRDFLARFSQTWGLEIGLEASPALEQRGLGAALEQAQWMGIIQEALSNIRKHASARRVSLRFEHSGRRLSLTIEDDGCGFDPVLLSQVGGSRFGMRSMSERAQALGGVFEIQSSPGQGTRISVAVPFDGEEGEAV